MMQSRAYFSYYCSFFLWSTPLSFSPEEMVSVLLEDSTVSVSALLEDPTKVVSTLFKDSLPSSVLVVDPDLAVLSLLVTSLEDSHK